MSEASGRTYGGSISITAEREDFIPFLAPSVPRSGYSPNRAAAFLREDRLYKQPGRVLTRVELLGAADGGGVGGGRAADAHMVGTVSDGTVSAGEGRVGLGAQSRTRNSYRSWFSKRGHQLVPGAGPTEVEVEE